MERIHFGRESGQRERHLLKRRREKKGEILQRTLRLSQKKGKKEKQSLGFSRVG